MRKIIILIAAAFVSASASAQVVTSRTIVKGKTETTWYARIGVSANNLTNGDQIFEDDDYDDTKTSIGSKAGMDVDFGFMKNIGKAGVYWGMELGIGTRGASLKEEGSDYDGDYTNKGSIMTWNLKYSPFTIGYKYAITDDLKLDAHLGAYVSYDFAGGSKYEWSDGDSEKLSFSEIKDENWDYMTFDAGMQIGIGAWWKKFNFDITYQRGFVPAAKVYYNHYYDSAEVYSSNLMFRVGYAF